MGGDPTHKAMASTADVNSSAHGLGKVTRPSMEPSLAWSRCRGHADARAFLVPSSLLALTATIHAQLRLTASCVPLDGTRRIVTHNDPTQRAAHDLLDLPCSTRLSSWQWRATRWSRLLHHRLCDRVAAVPDALSVDGLCFRRLHLVDCRHGPRSCGRWGHLAAPELVRPRPMCPCRHGHVREGSVGDFISLLRKWVPVPFTQYLFRTSRVSRFSANGETNRAFTASR
jgi:hypothetical protein